MAASCSVLLTPKIVKFLTKSSDQRERIEDNRAVARIGWRPCRPVRNPPLRYNWRIEYVPDKFGRFTVLFVPFSYILSSFSPRQE